MQQTLEILPGVTLRCIHDSRFKQSALSIQLLRPMTQAEAALNALLPAILLRGCREYPDLQLITQRLDDLYGASIGTLVRRIGDYQTTGFYCGFMEDRFALPGDEILAPMIRFAAQLLLEPVTEDGGFSRDFVESEKKNLISTIDSERSDKRTYAAGQLLKIMCQNDTFGIPRLGETEQVEAIDHISAYAHYQKILRESPIEIFYVGSATAEQVAALLTPELSRIERDPHPLPAQTPFQNAAGREESETQQIAQAKLALGFVTPITNHDPRFAAMQIMNAIFGSGMTSKLFMEVREKMSLCYAIGSGYYGSKGIMTVNAGIDGSKQKEVKEAIFAQLEACRAGNISENELSAAKESILSGLRSVYDSPGAIEGFFSTAAISGLGRTPEVYAQQIRAVTVDDVVEAARTVTFHSAFFLKGAANE
jgi:predicted Zn-dependent peptidase